MVYSEFAVEFRLTQQCECASLNINGCSHQIENMGFVVHNIGRGEGASDCLDLHKRGSQTSTTSFVISSRGTSVFLSSEKNSKRKRSLTVFANGKVLSSSLCDQVPWAW